uniref:Uncharacterized protein n=1 Tax=Solanum tuberosum TaxID=4113 RepID=M1CVK1_SOLTU
MLSRFFCLPELVGRVPGSYYKILSPYGQPFIPLSSRCLIYFDLNGGGVPAVRLVEGVSVI